MKTDWLNIHQKSHVGKYTTNKRWAMGKWVALCEAKLLQQREHLFLEFLTGENNCCLHGAGEGSVSVYPYTL